MTVHRVQEVTAGLRLFLILLLICTPVVVFADGANAEAGNAATGTQTGSAWEGSSAVGNAGEFPPAGLYAASNTFPRNSIVDVLNLDNGQRARLIVVRRLNAPGLFMLVSPEAGKDLGMSVNNIARLRVTPVTMPGLADVNAGTDLPYSPDPDINPVASVINPNASIEADRIASASTSGPPAVATKPTTSSTTPSAPKTDQLLPGVAATGPVAATPQPGTSVVPQLPKGPQKPLQETSPTEESAVPSAGTSLAAATPPEAAEKAGGETSVARKPQEAETARPSVPLPSTQIPSQEEAPVSAAELPEAPAPHIAQAVTPHETAEPSVAPSLFSKPAKTDQATAEISSLQNRTSPKNLFVAPQPESIASVLSPPNAPSEALNINPDRLAVANPGLESAPPVAARAGQATPSKPEISDLSLASPSTALSNLTLPTASLPTQEKPSVSEPHLSAAPESVSGENLPVASAPPSSHAEVTVLGPVAPPKPSEPSAEKGKIPQGAVVTLKPAEPRPPTASANATTAEERPTKQPAKSAAAPGGVAWAKKNLPMVSVLQRNSYYLQIGAYFSPESAKSALKRVAPGYPLVVTTAKDHGRLIYRLFVGPLGNDEKGAVLYWFKAQGYNDAFVRRGGES